MELIVPSDIIDVFDIMHDKSGSVVWEQAIQLAEDIRKVDAVPVVRCKDCKHYKEGELLSPNKFCFRLKDRNGEAIGYNFAEDGFCSYGERSEDERSDRNEQA